MDWLLSFGSVALFDLKRVRGDWVLFRWLERTQWLIEKQAFEPFGSLGRHMGPRVVEFVI